VACTAVEEIPEGGTQPEFAAGVREAPGDGEQEAAGELGSQQTYDLS
jgi:hypothetical protein